MSELADLKAQAKQTADGLATLTKSFNAVVEKMKSTPAGPTPQQVFGPPWARTGEDALSSRGFSFLKMLGVMTGQIEPSQAKIELDVHNRLHNVYVKSQGTAGYKYAGNGSAGAPMGKFLAPLACDFMHEDYVDHAFRHEMKSLVSAGVQGADPEGMRYLSKSLGGSRWGTKALSWLNEYSGGALVAPPEMGELIELLRNKEALVNAGARTVPLPPQGRMTYPRQTGASTAYWIGENAPIPDSNIGTGAVTLQAKKLCVRIIAPNELIRFASPAAEALMRDDMTKTLALALDLAGLEGNGGDHRPRGIINMPNIQTVTSSTTGADGDALVGKDIYRMVAAVEEANAEFEGWVMRPKTLNRYYQLRADAVSQGDSAGPFLFSLMRDLGDGTKPNIAGYPVTKSTQVSQVRSKGSASNLTYILGGMWSDLLIGMFGAIEFAATAQGDTSFSNDQTWVRGILSADIQARHEAAFAFMDNLIVTGA